MMGGTHEPDVNEEYQQEEPVETHPPVSVTVHGPTRVQLLPGVVTSMRRVSLPSDNSAVKIANMDYRRKSLAVLSIDRQFVLGTTKSEVEGNFSPQYPINVVISVDGITELWAKSDVGGQGVSLGIIETDWTE